MLAAPAPCPTDGLSASRVSADAGAGQRGVVYALTNTGQGSCSLAGFPGFAVLGSGGEALDGVRIVPSGDSSSGDESPPGPVFLAPGEQAVFDIRFTGIRATALRAAPPTPAS